jgi:transcriptional regulator with XRE-family HTH domain
MSIEVSHDGGRDPQRFQKVLNHLFATHRKKDVDGRDKPYTLREVAQGTGISIGYLSEARRGTIENPSLDKIELLARFFGVHPSIFLEPGPAESNTKGGSDEIADTLRQALAQPLVGQIALRAGAFSEVERSMILEIMDKVEQWSTELAAKNAERGRSSR